MPNYSQDYQGVKLRRGATGRGGWDKPNPNDPKAKMVSDSTIFDENNPFMEPLKKKGKVMNKK
jgi:hypothetical protein